LLNHEGAGMQRGKQGFIKIYPLTRRTNGG
jgi:hypothetical protein